MSIKTISSLETPFVKHDAIIVLKRGERVILRIMLVRYEGIIETYYQEEGYPYEYAYGIPATGMTRALTIAHANAINYLHYGED